MSQKRSFHVKFVVFFVGGVKKHPPHEILDPSEKLTPRPQKQGPTVIQIRVADSNFGDPVLGIGVSQM
jgi:hypothetical protein